MEKYSTYLNPDVEAYVKSSLGRCGYQYLNIECMGDYVVRQYKLNQFVVYFGMMSKEGFKPFDAWVIYGGGDVGLYNFDNYPTVNDAVAQHIGRLVLDSKLEIVSN
jgi:hypothetical protein